MNKERLNAQGPLGKAKAPAPNPVPLGWFHNHGVQSCGGREETDLHDVGKGERPRDRENTPSESQGLTFSLSCQELRLWGTIRLSYFRRARLCIWSVLVTATLLPAWAGPGVAWPWSPHNPQILGSWSFPGWNWRIMGNTSAELSTCWAPWKHPWVYLWRTLQSYLVPLAPGRVRICTATVQLNPSCPPLCTGSWGRSCWRGTIATPPWPSPPVLQGPGPTVTWASVDHWTQASDSAVKPGIRTGNRAPPFCCCQSEDLQAKINPESSAQSWCPSSIGYHLPDPKASSDAFPSFHSGSPEQTLVRQPLRAPAPSCGHLPLGEGSGAPLRQSPLPWTEATQLSGPRDNWVCRDQDPEMTTPNPLLSLGRPALTGQDISEKMHVRHWFSMNWLPSEPKFINVNVTLLRVAESHS